MKKQIFAVCDLEAEYARNFMDYLNQKKNIPFEIQAFTNVSSFVAYAKENPVELLLISAESGNVVPVRHLPAALEHVQLLLLPL